MEESGVTSYDEVNYPSFPIYYSHPDRLATMASLFGMKPAPIEQCRVLELGCFDGVNLAAMAVGLPAGLFLNPAFPMPFENNLAMVDFVELHHSAAQFLEESYPEKTIYTAWPLTQALRDPQFGYVNRKLSAAETSDLHFSTLNAIDPKGVDVLVLYSRTWEPGWGVLQWTPARDFLHRFYEYERQMTLAEVRGHFGLVPVRRWTQRGQWIEVYARL